MQMTEDEYVRYTIYKIELAMFIVWPSLCKKDNKRIDRITIIMDLKNTNQTQF